MKHLRKVCLWYCFAATYSVVMILLFVLLPEERIYSFWAGGSNEIDSISWENNYSIALLIISLAINGVIIFLTSLLLSKRRR